MPSRYTRRLLGVSVVALAASGIALISAGPAAAAPSSADTTFMTSNEQTNPAEIAIGQIALAKAQSSQARDLATMTLADHQATMARLTSVASALGFTLPTTPNAEQQAQAATLQATPAGSFDAAYAQIQVAGHQQSIAATNTEMSSGSDPTVTEYANYYLPIATKHLGMAQTAAADLGGVPGSVPAGIGGQAATTSGTTQAFEISGILIGSLVVLCAGVMLVRRRRVVV